MLDQRPYAPRLLRLGRKTSAFRLIYSWTSISSVTTSPLRGKGHPPGGWIVSASGGASPPPPCADFYVASNPTLLQCNGYHDGINFARVLLQPSKARNPHFFEAVSCNKLRFDQSPPPKPQIPTLAWSRGKRNVCCTRQTTLGTSPLVFP